MQTINHIIQTTFTGKYVKVFLYRVFFRDGILITAIKVTEKAQVIQFGCSARFNQIHCLGGLGS